MTTVGDHYTVLGVPRHATEEEIKRAWARLVRIYTPDKNPEQNRRINEAKTTLLDPKARADYDALLDYGDEIEELLEQAQEAREDEDWDEAIRCFREILAFHPGNHSVRNQLALCQAESGDLDGAIRTLHKLVQKEGGVALYWANLGLVLKDKASECESAALYQEAERAIRRALEIEPRNASFYIYLSRIARAQGDFERAEGLVEQAVHADGKVDEDDIDLLFELVMVHLFAQNLPAIVQDAQRIRGLIREGREELIEYAQHRFLGIAFDLFKKQLYHEAHAFTEAAASLGPLPEAGQELLQHFKRCTTILNELEALKKDPNMNKAIALAAYTAVAGFFDWESDAEQEKNVQLVGHLLLITDDETIQGSLSRLRYNYKAIYALQPQWFDSMRGYGASRFRYSSSLAGCCALPMAAAVAALLAGLVYLLAL